MNTKRRAIEAKERRRQGYRAKPKAGPMLNIRLLRQVRLVINRRLPRNLALAFAVLAALPGGALERAVPAPAFTHTSPADWLNSAPLTWEDLRGKVVLMDFWTFECWNCYRSFPWMNALEARLQPLGLQVIGVHTPEFEHEKVRENVVAKAAEFGLHHPIMLDNDFSYWRAMNNRYWPAFYLVDKRGAIRAAFYGETRAGDRRARQIEQLARQLLAES